MARRPNAAFAIVYVAATTALASPPVALTVAPATNVQMTFTVTTPLGGDADGPNTVVVTGTAVGELGTAVDPTHGLVAASLLFSSSEIDFADTSFSIAVRFPVTYSFEGIAGEWSAAPLAPGTPIGPGLAGFDQTPLSLTWTEGATVVDFTSESIPVAGMEFDSSGTATVSTIQNGGQVDVVVTIPVDASAVRTDPFTFSTDETQITGEIVLVGSYPIAQVPSLDGPGILLLALAMLAGGVHPLVRNRPAAAVHDPPPRARVRASILEPTEKGH